MTLRNTGPYLLTVLLLTSWSTAFSVMLNVAVVIENGVINRSLVETAFARRVSSNWRLLNGHSISPVIIESASCSITMTTRHYPNVVQSLQDGFSSRGIGSVLFQLDSGAGLRADLNVRLRGLLKKQIFHTVVVAEPETALGVLSSANASLVLQQNYFWLLVDTGLSPSLLKRRLPANANVALLRSRVGELCKIAALDVFETCDSEWVRSLDARFVDAVETLAKALNDTVIESTFLPSNATCNGSPQVWSAGPIVVSKMIRLTNYNPGRGPIGYNSTSRHFDSQEIELIGSYNRLRSSPVQLIRSALFNTRSGTLTTLFYNQGVTLVFPNTFTGFKNETIVVCSPVYPPFTNFETVYPNNTVVVSGMLLDLLDIMAIKMEFRYLTKTPDDGQWGGPQSDKSYYTGCVGELQRDVSWKNIPHFFRIF